MSPYRTLAEIAKDMPPPPAPFPWALVLLAIVTTAFLCFAPDRWFVL